jgi:hypothetical protein
MSFCKIRRVSPAENSIRIDLSPISGLADDPVCYYIIFLFFMQILRFLTAPLYFPGDVFSHPAELSARYRGKENGRPALLPACRM